jgi:lysophospholipase L1-like esterase
MANAEIIATTGWTTLDLGNGIDTTNPQGPYDLVSLLIGVNDQYQGKDIAHYPERFTTLLNRAVTLAGGRKERVFVLSIPDYAYTPFGQTRDVERISREIDAYNDINRRVTREMDITYFDITPVSRNGLAQPDLVASDGLHPSGSMYQQWVAQMVSVIKQKLD